jgi:polyisoprenoid-binding protein YceI
MRRSTRAALAVALLSLASGTAGRAETYVLRLDPATTRIQFELDAFLHKVHGTAKLAHGEIRFDPDGAAEGEVVVSATSAETGDQKRDKDMHVKVLESAQFAEIVLSVSGFEGKFDAGAPSKVKVKGRLRIHGAEHPVTLDMSLEPAASGAAKSLAVTATFAVPYVEWGMTDPSKAFLRVGKEVEVSIEAHGTFAPANR